MAYHSQTEACAFSSAETIHHSRSGEKISDEEGQDFGMTFNNTADDNGFGGSRGQNFRTMGRWDTVSILLTNQVGLGILSLPGVLKVLGIIPGVMAIVGIGCLSWYTAFELSQFYRRYPHVLNIVDMAQVVGGWKFAVVTGVGFLVQVTMTATSVTVTLSLAFGVLSGNSINPIGFMGIGCFCCWLLCSPRTAKFVSWSGIPSCISTLAATLLVIISLIISGPAAAPRFWEKELVIFGTPTFRDGLNACLKVCYAYSSNANFVSYMAEMADPIRDFNFALAWLEISSISLYAIISTSIYCLAGEYTASPALGSGSPQIVQIAYGIVLPSILSKGLAFGHTGIKFVYVETMKRFKIAHEMTAQTTRSWSIWMTVVTIFWVLCFILSVAIPVFDSILSITSAATISWFTFGFSAVLWFYMNWGAKSIVGRKAVLICGNIGLFLLSLFLNTAGLWSSIHELLHAPRQREI